MAINKLSPLERRSRGLSGENIGALLGAGLAGAAAIPTGGLSLAAAPAILGAATAGANVGGLAGRVAGPQEKPPISIGDGPIQRRAQQAGPQISDYTLALKDALSLAKQSPEHAQYQEPLKEAAIYSYANDMRRNRGYHNPRF